LPRKSTDIVVGLDVGTTKVCAIVGEVDAAGRLTILGSGLVPSDGIRRGVVADIAAAVASIRAAVELAEQNSGVHIEAVSVGVTGEHVTSLNSRGVVAVNNPHQEITAEDVEHVLESAKSIVLPPDREILHNIPRGFIVDGLDGITHPEGMSGTRLEAETHIVTGARTFIDNVLKCVYRAGLQVEGGGVVLQPLATAEAVLLPAERELGVAIVDIGGGTTDIAAFINGSIAYTGVVPVGGDHVTRDIAVGIRVSLEEAERLKVDWGAGLADLLEQDELVDVTMLGATEPVQLPRSILAEIIEARMIELFENVKDHLRKSGILGQIPAGVVITGGGSRLHGTDQAAAEVLETPVRLASPTEDSGLVETVNHPRYATAVGLVRLAAKSARGPSYSEPLPAPRGPGRSFVKAMKRLWPR
jgi:cell division protein FtsA